MSKQSSQQSSQQLRRARTLAGACTLLLLAACGDSDVQEVKQWMAQVKAETKVQVAPLSEPKTFVPFAYGEKEAVDPFNPNKLLGELARVAKASDAFKPDMDRPKEPLEAFPLDTIKMVGTMQKRGVTYALLQIDRQVYRVTPGQYLGQNYGKITKVAEDAVQVNEIVQDATGDWVERKASLELQERQENKQ